MFSPSLCSTKASIRWSTTPECVTFPTSNSKQDQHIFIHVNIVEIYIFMNKDKTRERFKMASVLSSKNKQPSFEDVGHTMFT